MSTTANNNKWRKRKRQSQGPEDDDEDYIEDETINDEDHELLLEEDEDTTNPIITITNNNGVTPYHQESEVLSGGGTRISDFPTAFAHTVNRPHSSVLEIVAAERAVQFPHERNQNPNLLFLENISHGQFQALSAVPVGAPDGSSSMYVCTAPAIMEGRGVVKRYGNGHSHAVPMHADWFFPNSVHRLERQAVPHFFCGKSSDLTPEKYMECRNRIVARYIENPERRLLVTDCQGLVTGVDVHDMNRILRFLDHWGIVNYNAPAPNREPRIGGPYLREEPNGEIQIPSPALRSIYSLIHFDKPKSRIRSADICASPLCHDDDISDLENSIRERLSENHCSFCSRTVTRVYYQSQKEVDALLCSDCFHEGRFIVGHSSIDFIRADPTKEYFDFDGDNWTDQETLLLLEAVEVYVDNWNEIAEHVGTKSKAQCILHFIRLPIEDDLLETVEVPSQSVALSTPKEEHGRQHSNPNGDSAGIHLQELGSGSSLPFTNHGNPAMALVAFLASAVGPRVAAACAHASLATLSKEEIDLERNSSQLGDSREGGPHGSVAGISQRNDENVAVHGSSSGNNTIPTQLPIKIVKEAAKCGLAAAASKAKLFADHEEREIQRMTASIVNQQLKRLELKLKQFAEVETLLVKESEQVERTRQRIATERARVISTGFLPSVPVTATTSIPGAMNNGLNNMQMSALHLQTNMGYGVGQQQTHQHMSFMPLQQQQPMYAYGPRLPLSAIHPSSSGPSSNNVMFNAPLQGNNVSTNLGHHPMLRPVSSASNLNVG
ncbi:hypothetical protein GIB67_031978 [Kingdonia uniflora]|uniref:SWI/SNF complex subunit SWI3C n=1 Tax=Kingdonia uniflora TaxID=39325 RepID=A0A7J7NU42_9MAGN|nr:hypothetical protein GIB67_031978 [Kingdonia uniflora]